MGIILPFCTPEKFCKLRGTQQKTREEVPNSPDRSETKTDLAKKLERQASHNNSRNAVGKVDILGGGIASPLGVNWKSRKYSFGAICQYNGALGRFDGWRQVTRDFSQEDKQRRHDEVRGAPRPLHIRVPQTHPPSDLVSRVLVPCVKKLRHRRRVAAESSAMQRDVSILWRTALSGT